MRRPAISRGPSTSTCRPASLASSRAASARRVGVRWRGGSFTRSRAQETDWATRAGQRHRLLHLLGTLQALRHDHHQRLEQARLLLLLLGLVAVEAVGAEQRSLDDGPRLVGGLAGEARGGEGETPGAALLRVAGRVPGREAERLEAGAGKGGLGAVALAQPDEQEPFGPELPHGAEGQGLAGLALELLLGRGGGEVAVQPAVDLGEGALRIGRIALEHGNRQDRCLHLDRARARHLDLHPYLPGLHRREGGGKRERDNTINGAGAACAPRLAAGCGRGGRAPPRPRRAPAREPGRRGRAGGGPGRPS